MNIERLRSLVQAKRYKISDHVLRRSSEWQIPLIAVIEVVLGGEVIENYPNDYPFPSCLMFSMSNARPIHVVVAIDEKGDMAYFVTVYEPDLKHFEADFKTRRKRQ